MKPRVQIYGSCECLLAQFPPHRSRPAWAAVAQMLFVTEGAMEEDVSGSLPPPLLVNTVCQVQGVLSLHSLCVRIVHRDRQ